MHVRLQVAEIARGVGPQPVALQGGDVARIVVVVFGIIDGVGPGAHGTIELFFDAVVFIVMILIFHDPGLRTAVADLDAAVLPGEV